LDSDEGAEEGQYAHNEDFVFTVCIDGATEIVVAFSFFATEANFDVLTAYDGPDTNSPLVAELSGILQPPPTLVANSGCITFHFVSDENIAALGWEANWYVEIDEPESPEILLAEQPECPMENARFQFDNPIPCDLFVADNFNLLGPSAGNITQVEALDCDPNTGLAQTFEVSFSPAPELGGNYRLFFEGEIEDACGNLHEVDANLLFELANCPLSVEVWSDSDCAGECGTLYSEVFGGSGNYAYQWSHTGTNAASVEVCSEEPITLQLMVTDLQGGQTAEIEYTYYPFELPVFLNPFEADTFCASRGDHIYSVSIPDGSFYSEIIPGGHRHTGRYQFWRWRFEDPINMDIIQYVDPNGCSVFDTVFVKHIWAGNREAACLGADPFQVIDAFPSEGYWTGPNVDSSGLFNPVAEGSFLLTYHTFDGCSQNKRVNVGAELIMPEVDTICSSQRIDLQASIYGGRWYGPGITNRILGRIEAWRMSPNQSYTYTYILEGCEAEMEIYIKEINAGSDRTICSSDSLFYPSVSGNWSGPGIFIESENAFDISGLSPGTYRYTLSLDDCQDGMDLTIEEVAVGIHTEAFFCLVDDYYWLGDYLWITPGGGTLEGPGVSFFSDTWFFNPSEAGSGDHWIVYRALGCSDSVSFTVEEPAIIPEFEFCERNSPVTLTATPPGGSWQGDGFLDGQSGLYDPRIPGIGIHNITYLAPSGCATDGQVEIFPFEEVSIDGLSQQYCFSDTLIQLVLEPEGGIFTINSEESEPEFNPVELGTGIHEILYSRGTGECASSERRFITILNPIGVEVPLTADSICPGENVVLEALGTGGVGGLTYIWDNDLGFGSSQIAFPDSSQWYVVTISDQCSEPFRDSIYIHLHEDVATEIEYGPEVCYEDSTYAEITWNSQEDYLVEWQTQPPNSKARLVARPGIYVVEIVDRETGCSQEMTVQLPGSRPLTANFSFFPNQPCIDLANNRLEIINLSVGYTNLYIDFGEGSGLRDFSEGGIIFHEYEEPGTYDLVLQIENELGCVDSMQRTICVENVVNLYIPTAFSPNGDGVNDLLELYSIGVREDVHWMIFNRYGAKVFESQSLYDSWDGFSAGERMPPGVYLLVAQYFDKETGEPLSREQEVLLLR
nr:gliding motility-associated C-terminal domain-containing protein [Saprospiraceae bacterium]